MRTYNQDSSSAASQGLQELNELYLEQVGGGETSHEALITWSQLHAHIDVGGSSVLRLSNNQVFTPNTQYSYGA